MICLHCDNDHCANPEHADAQPETGVHVHHSLPYGGWCHLIPMTLIGPEKV